MSDRVSQWYDMKNKVVFLTGATGKLGRHYSEVLSEVGANMILIDLAEKQCEEFSTVLSQKFETKPMGLAVNIENKQEVFSAVEKVIERYKKIDVLINNAAAHQVNYVDGNLHEFEEYPLEVKKFTPTFSLAPEGKSEVASVSDSIQSFFYQ